MGQIKRIKRKKEKGSLKKKKNEMKIVTIRRHADAPRCREGYERREIAAVRHETVTLRCEIEAVPDELIRFSWSFNGTRGDILPLPNSRVRDNGLVSSLDYTPSADTDYGTLACWASNSIGRQRLPCLFNVVPASKYYYLLTESIKR